MKRSSSLSQRDSRSPGPVRILRLVAMAVVIGFLLYTSWQRGQQQPAQQPPPIAQPGDPIPVRVIDELPDRNQPAGEKSEEDRPAPDQSAESERAEGKGETKPAPKPETKPESKTETKPAEQAASREAARVKTEIKGAVIKNQDGRVIYRGDIDLSETLARIERGERDDHPNDGSVFQNRERRLPKQPSGYYREWVHPTPKQRGPGPQRIVTGKNGEIYYTPDHYETFQRLNGAGVGN